MARVGAHSFRPPFLKGGEPNFGKFQKGGVAEGPKKGGGGDQKGGGLEKGGAPMVITSDVIFSEKYPGFLKNFACGGLFTVK